MHELHGVQGEMMQNKIGICVCARMDSNRLPGKVLRKIGGRHALEILLEHVIQHSAYPVVLAIPEAEKDDPIVNMVQRLQIPVEVYRGHDDSPTHRMMTVAKKKKWDFVVRVTADDLFIDQRILKKQVQWSVDHDLDYLYMTRCVEGIAAEVIKVSALQKVVDELGSQPCEYLGYMLRREDFKYMEFFPENEFQKNYRLTLDYPEDLHLIRIVDANLPKNYNTLDIIHYLGRNSSLLRINALPKVTVYTVNYNYADHVIEAIESVLDQSYTDWEYHIWDDASTDNSLNRIVSYVTGLNQKMRDKIKVFANKENLGLPATCNKELKHAKGKYLLRLDSDDVLTRDALRIMASSIEYTNGINGVFSRYGEIDDHSMRLRDNIENTAHHPGCCLLSTRSVNEIKYRDGIELGEGKEFFERFFKFYNVSHIDKQLWHYRRHEGQKTHEKESEVVK